MAGAFTPVNAPVAIGLQNQGIPRSMFAPASSNFPVLPPDPTPVQAAAPTQAAPAPSAQSTSIAPAQAPAGPALNMRVLASDPKRKSGGATSNYGNATLLSSVGSSVNVKTLLGS
jgi:transcription elongation factor